MCKLMKMFWTSSNFKVCTCTVFFPQIFLQCVTMHILSKLINMEMKYGTKKIMKTKILGKYLSVLQCICAYMYYRCICFSIAENIAYDHNNKKRCHCVFGFGEQIMIQQVKSAASLPVWPSAPSPQLYTCPPLVR